MSEGELKGLRTALELVLEEQRRARDARAWAPLNRARWKIAAKIAELEWARSPARPAQPPAAVHHARCACRDCVRGRRGPVSARPRADLLDSLRKEAR